METSCAILVSGSLAYDRIMDFPGAFKDHIMPDKIHVLSISFEVKTFEERFGGTAGNIAYTLKLLGCDPKIFAAVGNDFGAYEQHFKKQDIDISYITRVPHTKTACAHIITDRDDNQITAFFPGALYEGIVSEKIPENVRMAIVAPEPIITMCGWVALCKKRAIPYVFDPGQQIIRFSQEELRKCIQGAKLVIGNDYEIGLLLQKVDMDEREVLNCAEILIITYGEKGSKIYTSERVYDIDSVKPEKFVDPTGAGDAYRAGFIAGMVEGKSLEECGRLAALVASKPIEHYGAQEHRFTRQEYNL